MGERNFIVLYSSHPEEVQAFYTALLGKPFVKVEEKQGENTLYTCSLDSLVIGVYSTKGAAAGKKSARETQRVALGFNVSSLEVALQTPEAQEYIYQQPQQRDYGRVALLHDPDGRKVILVERKTE